MAVTINADTSNGLVMTPDTSGEIKLQSAGTDTVTVDSSGNVGIGTSSPARPLEVKQSGDSFISITAGNSNSSVLELGDSDDINIGRILYNHGSNYLATYTNNTERMRIASDGRAMINRTSAANSAFLSVGGTISASFTGRMYSLGTYNNTTGSGANMHIASDGHMFRSTSSLKYKTDVQDATHGLNDVMNLRAVTYKGKTDGDTVFGGLIAEEVHDAGLTEFVQYDDDGNPDAIHYGHMVSLAFKAIQELKTENDTLKSQLSDLETRIQALENA